MSETKRREFLQASAAGAATLGLVTSSVRAEQTSNDKLVLAVIGPGGRGRSLIRQLQGRTDVEIAYVCDVDRRRLDDAVEAAEDVLGTAPRAVGDMRTVLDDQRVDAVIIATPDHWHAPASILALDAGKHVYVEKPCCHNIREGRLLADAVQRSGKVLQVGTQSRSAPFLQEVVQRVQEGEIGEVLVAKAWNSQRRGNIGKSSASVPPPELDYDNWVGPATMHPYRRNMLPGRWRWWRHFGCGDIGNDGVHDIDVALWGLGVETHPTQAACFGGKYYWDDDQQFPDTQYGVFEYPIAGAPEGRRRQLIFEQRIWTPYVLDGYEAGSALYGDKGCFVIGHVRGWRLYGERNKLIEERVGRPETSDHYENFFACIRGDATEIAADVMAGHRAAAIAHLANIGARVGRSLEFDPATEQIVGDDEANAMVRRQYREEHWGTPQNV